MAVATSPANVRMAGWVWVAGLIGGMVLAVGVALAVTEAFGRGGTGWAAGGSGGTIPPLNIEEASPNVFGGIYVSNVSNFFG